MALKKAKTPVVQEGRSTLGRRAVARGAGPMGRSGVKGGPYDASRSASSWATCACRR
jgi:hypothetical protein